MKRPLRILLILLQAGLFVSQPVLAELDDPPWSGSRSEPVQEAEALSGEREAVGAQAPLPRSETLFPENLRRWLLVSASWVFLAVGLALVLATVRKTCVWLRAVQKATRPPTRVFNLQLQVRSPAGDFSLHNFDYYPIIVASHGTADLLLPSPLGQRDRFRIDYRQGQTCLVCETPLIVNGVPREEKVLKEGDRILFGAYRLAFRDASVREQGAALPGKPVFAWQFSIMALLLALSVMFRQAGAEPRDKVLARARAGKEAQVEAAASSARQAALRRPATPSPAPRRSAASSPAAGPEADGAVPAITALAASAYAAVSKPDAVEPELRTAEKPLVASQPAVARPGATRPAVAQEAAIRPAAARRVEPQPPRSAVPQPVALNRAEPRRAESQSAEPRRAESQSAEPQRAEPQRMESQRAEPQRMESQSAEPQPPRSAVPQPVGLSRAGPESGRVLPEPQRFPVRVVAPGRPIDFFQADVLFIHAHPDDESIDFGALMAKISRSGKRIVTLLFTDGESGLDLYPQRMIGDIYPARPLEGGALSQVRVVEAARALSILGSEVYLRWGLDNHAYNNKRDELALQEVLEAWGGEEELLDRLIGILAGFRPTVVVSPDRASAAYEHFEHEAVGYLVDKALQRLLREGGSSVKGHLVSVDPYQKGHYPGSIGIAALEQDPESGLAYRAIQVQALKEHVTQRDAALIAVSRLNHLPLELYQARFWELGVSVEEFFK